MAEFKRSRREKKVDEELSKKTIWLGLATVVVLGLLLTFGLPLLIKFSIVMGDLKNRSTASITEKVLPPVAPRIELPYEATNSSQISVTGFAEKGVTVELLKNDVAVAKTVADDSGQFNFDGVQLDQGESIFTAIAISDKGGNGEPSKEAKILFDNMPPSLTMTNPSEDSLTVSSADFDVTGQSEPGVSVTVNGRVAMVDDSGKFKIKLQLNTGKNDIQIVVKDAAGNETDKSISITYDI